MSKDMKSNEEQHAKMQEEKDRKKQYIAKLLRSSNPASQKAGKIEQESYNKQYGKD